MRIQPSWKWLLLSHLLLVAAACSSKDDTSHLVGPSGGTVRIDDGGQRTLDMNFPAGALGSTVDISSTRITDTTALPQSSTTGASVTLVGPFTDLGPEGSVFASPVLLSFHYDASALGDVDPTELRVATVSGDVWVLLESPAVDTAAGTVSGSTLHFSRFGVIAVGCTTAADCNDNNVCTSDSCNGSGKCVVTPASGACSDGNACTEGDRCNGGTCESGATVACNPVCGNGNIEGSETCDDGNAASGDGCTACAVDAGWSCAGSPSVCTPPVASGDDVDGDGYASSNDCIDTWAAYCGKYAGLKACSARNQACNDYQTCVAIQDPATCAATPGCYFLQICHNYVCATGAGNCDLVYPSCPSDGSAPASPRTGYRPEDIHPNAGSVSTDVCQDGLDNDCNGSDAACPVALTPRP